MALVPTLVANVAPPINFVLMRGLLTQTRKKCPFHNGTVAGELQKHGGSMSVKWRRWDDLAVSVTPLGEAPNPIVYGMGRDSAAATVTDITVATAKYGKLITYSEEVDLFNVNTRAAEMLTPIGRNAGVTLDKLMANVFDAETTAIFSNGSATAAVNTAIAAADVNSAYVALDSADGIPFDPMSTGSTLVGSSPIRESYLGICHPHVAFDIRAITGFLGVEQYASGTNTYIGEFGTVGGVRWVSSTNSPIEINAGGTPGTMRSTAGSSADVYSSFVYAMNAMGSVGLGEKQTVEIYKEGTIPATIEIIRHGVEDGGLSNPFNEVGGIAWKCWWAGKTLDSTLIKKIESAATDV